jgi:hypothetical protein
MVWLGQAVLDAVALAGSIEGMAAPSCGRSRAVLRQIGELDAVIGENHVDRVGDRLDQLVQEGDRSGRIGLRKEPGERDLRGAVDGDEEVELAFLCAQLGDVDVGATAV